MLHRGEAMIAGLTSFVKDMPARLRALPRALSIADMFSGSGTCSRVVGAAVEQLESAFPSETEELRVGYMFDKSINKIKISSVKSQESKGKSN